jgi:hypothetical protein
LGYLNLSFTAETLRAQRFFYFLLSGERPESKKNLPCGAFIPVVKSIPQ